MTSFQRCGSKNGLIGALIERRARSVTTTLEAVVSAPGEPREILQSFAVGLLGLLLGDESVALNRALLNLRCIGRFPQEIGRNRCRSGNCRERAQQNAAAAPARTRVGKPHDAGTEILDRGFAQA
jgi:hypothetical protein